MWGSQSRWRETSAPSRVYKLAWRVDYWCSRCRRRLGGDNHSWGDTVQLMALSCGATVWAYFAAVNVNTTGMTTGFRPNEKLQLWRVHQSRQWASWKYMKVLLFPLANTKWWLRVMDSKSISVKPSWNRLLSPSTLFISPLVEAPGPAGSIVQTWLQDGSECVNTGLDVCVCVLSWSRSEHRAVSSHKWRYIHQFISVCASKQRDWHPLSCTDSAISCCCCQFVAVLQHHVFHLNTVWIIWEGSA